VSVEENKAIVRRWTEEGFGKRVASIPPTDMRVAVTRIAVFRVVDGEISEQRAQVDMLGLLRRLGEIPPSGQGSS
jgi:predicted ester cyclase